MASLYQFPPAPDPVEKGLFDLMPCGLVICDGRGRVLKANRFFRDLSGLPPETFNSKASFDQYLTRPSRFIFAAQVVPQLNHMGEAREIALDIEGPDGNGIAVLINAHHDKATDQRHFAVFPARDRREHEREMLRAQKELKQHREYLELAERLAKVGHWHIDMTNGACHWSPEIYNIYGCDPETYQPVEGGTIDFYHPDDRDHIRKIIAEAKQEKRPFAFRKRLIRATGEMRIVEASGVCECNPQGQVVGLFGVFRDVTDSVKAQERIEQSEARYRLLADHANDIITIFDLSGQFEYISPAVSQVLGYEPAELIGRNVRDIVLPEDYGPTLGAYQTYFKSKNWDDAPRIQYRAQHKDGRFVWVEAHPTVILDATGTHVIAFQDVVRDISDQKATEVALAKASVEANAAAEAKAAFLATMSHELRTPLTSIIGYSSLLRDLLPSQQTDAPDLRRHAQRIHSAGQGLLSLINDILDHSKLEAGQVELDINPCSVAELVAETIDLLAIQAQVKGLSLTVARAESLPDTLPVDEVRLRQILLNLISNAVKFTYQGGVSVSLKMRGGKTRPKLFVSVRDTGPGISVEAQGRLFQRFSQVHKDSNAHGGTGLGLLICKQLTQLMKGTIGVNSREGEGAEFWFEIPVAEATNDTTEVDNVSAAPQVSGRILVVEDHVANRDLLKVMLNQLGHEVYEASNGAEALQACLARTYDLILMDINMPVMDGLVATRGIRINCELNAHTPILALTAAGEARTSACLAAGMNALIDKPVKPATLSNALSLWLSQPQSSPSLKEHRA